MVLSATVSGRLRADILLLGVHERCAAAAAAAVRLLLLLVQYSAGSPGRSHLIHCDQTCGANREACTAAHAQVTGSFLTHPHNVWCALCRADWKACAASKAEEEARTERFKKAFAPYDIMQ